MAARARLFHCKSLLADCWKITTKVRSLPAADLIVGYWLYRLCSPGGQKMALDDEVQKSPTPSSIKVAIIEDRREIRESLFTLIRRPESSLCARSSRSIEAAPATIGTQLA